MEPYPVLGKLASWTTVVGACVGAFIVAFLVYPPHVGWGSHEKWGDVGGWVGAAATSFAAVVALWIAGREDRARAEQRSMDASILASLLTHELSTTWDDARQCSAQLDFAEPGTTLSEYHALRPYFGAFGMPETLARVEKLSVLPRDLALDIAMALSFRARLVAGLEFLKVAEKRWIAGPGGIRKISDITADLSHFADTLSLCVPRCQELAFEGRMAPWDPEFTAKVYGVGE